MDDGVPARWEELPLLPAGAAREAVDAGLRASLARPGILVVVAGVLGWFGRIDLAIGAAGAAVVLLHAVVVSPQVRSVLRRLEHGFSTLVGTVLGTLLLLPVHLLVVTPVGLALRAFGVKPLERGTGPQSTSTWHLAATTPRPTGDRMFSHEGAWRPAAPRAHGRALVIRTVVAVLLVQAAIVGVVQLIDRRTTPEPQLAGAGSVGAGRSPALSGQPWVEPLMAELAGVSKGIVYAPFTGSTLRDFHGEYVNVTSRVRRSYEPEFAADADPIDVWFFGGSTMFGFDAQRDLHTIPSEFVRIAQSHGIPVRARNYGSPGFVNYQETMLLALTTAEERPDLVVFYDGINDVSLQLVNAIGELGPLGEPGSLGDVQQRKALFETGDIPGGRDAPPEPLHPTKQDGRLSAAKIAEAVSSVYRQGMDVAAALAARRGFEVLHMWQPTIYSKHPLDPGESGRLEVIGFDSFRFDVMTALYKAVTDALPPGIIDLSDALDGTEGPVLADSVHINEVGAAAVAAAMFDNARPTLERLRQPG